MDLSSNLDLHRIVFVQVGLSTLASVSVSPSYNLPIHLYGLYNIDNEVDNPTPGVLEGLRQYCILLVLTAVLDLFWMYNWSSSTSGIPFMLILIGLIIKPISLLTCLNQLNRNGQGLGSFSSQFTGSPWAPSHSTAPFRRAENAPPPGPSSVSHQASAAHEFALDDNADAQNLSDDEALLQVNLSMEVVTTLSNEPVHSKVSQMSSLLG
ncbi:hypothetical protein PtB15_3B610 [Puccinia triticina]|nr:hypothetical protein PtB15_3B610 [Puccinia triticina]